jgi:NADPH:quinone reductase-like Zn-dependent oxidoreductase
MQAFICEKYGPPEMLRMGEVEKPAPDVDEVLVRVLAISVNPADWHSMRGKPLFSRATLGLLRPKHKILGVDIAGQVEAVGSGVTRFVPGDEVYANLLDHGYGGFAEYVSVALDVMSSKPANLSFEEAAAVPMLAVTALQGLRHHGEIQPVRKVLINGASGGVGTFAVQIAKSYGAEVTGVTSTPNIDLVRSLGANHVVDYTTTDFTRSGQRYDLILDTIGNRSVPDLRRALAEGGKGAVTGFTSMGKLMGVSLRGGKDIAMVTAHITTKDLELLSELIEAGKMRPQIDRSYPFAEIPAAIAYLEQGRARGKVVVGWRKGYPVRPHLARPAASPASCCASPRCRVRASRVLGRPSVSRGVVRQLARHRRPVREGPSASIRKRAAIDDRTLAQLLTK